MENTTTIQEFLGAKIYIPKFVIAEIAVFKVCNVKPYTNQSIRNDNQKEAFYILVGIMLNETSITQKQLSELTLKKTHNPIRVAFTEHNLWYNTDKEYTAKFDKALKIYKDSII